MGHRIDIPAEQYLKGLDEAARNIQSAVDSLERTSVEGLAEALVFIAGEAQQRAPVDTGDLRGSVEVRIDGELYAQGKKGTDEIDLYIVGELPESASKGEVSFNTPYAAVQHEQTAYDHRTIAARMGFDKSGGD